MITIIDTPFEIASAHHPVVYSVSSDATAPDLRIRAQINYSINGLTYESLGSLYGSFDGTNFYFDVSERLKTVLSYDMPTLDDTSHFEFRLPNTIVTYRIIFTEQYSNAQGLITNYATATSPDRLAINARYLREEGLNIEPYIMSLQNTAPYGRFLSDAPQIKQIRKGEFEVLHFLSNEAGVHNIKIGLQRSNAPFTVQILDSDSLEMRMGMIFLSIDDYYTDDLQFIEVWVTDSNDIRISEIKRFMIDRSCARGEYRLLWRNTKGGLDAYTFTATDVESMEYEREIAGLSLNAITEPRDHERVITRSSRRRSINASSKFETYQVRRWLASLFSAQQVWLIDTANTLRPVYINNTEYTLKENRRLIQVPVSFSYDDEQLV